jgi:hypothetical protein
VLVKSTRFTTGKFYTTWEEWQGKFQSSTLVLHRRISTIQIKVYAYGIKLTQ